MQYMLSTLAAILVNQQSKKLSMLKTQAKKFSIMNNDPKRSLFFILVDHLFAKCYNTTTMEKSKEKQQKASTKNKRKFRFYADFLKRVFDICLSLFALIILALPIAIISLISLIKIGRPVIFSQPRPGKNCKVFMFYKFRSMKNAVDKNGNPLPDEQRITKWGKIIRKTSLDELPQLWNILKGDMSFVGPRPRMVKDMVFYSKETMDAYTVRPGLTGIDQVYGRNQFSWEKIFDVDREYAEKCSFCLDLKLFFATFVSIFKNEGSAGGAETSKREYWYSDYLLKQNTINKDEYEKGLELAKAIEQIKFDGKNVNIKEEVLKPENKIITK